MMKPDAPHPDGSVFDVFISLGGPDRGDIHPVADALERAGLRVFLDVRSIRYFTGITPRIRSAIAASKTVLVCYSAEYPRRSACQWELTAAFHMASRLGHPSRRLLVINREDTEEHIAPGELSDARFSVWPRSKTDLRLLSSAIVARVAELTGPLSAGEDVAPVRWLPDGVRRHPHFVGRYRDLWELHTRLLAPQHSLTAGLAAPAAVVAGMGGIGKSALVAEYARQFEAFHPGGVYWTEAFSWYDDEVRRIAETAGIATAGMTPHRMFAVMAAHLDERSGPSLWVVDEVAAGLPVEALRRFVLPSTSVRTVLISRDAGYGELAPVVEIGPMTDEDAGDLLARMRGDDGEPESTARITRLVGGHPMGLVAAGTALRDGTGLLSAADLIRRLESGPPGSAGVGTVLDGTVTALDDAAKDALDLAAVLAPGAIPSVMFAAVAGPAGDAAERTRRALGTLRRHMLATRTGPAWTVHPLVIDAVRRNRAPRPHLPGEAAEAILRLLPDAAEPVLGHLLRHADTLGRHIGVPDESAAGLLRSVAAHRTVAGDPAGAAGVYATLDDRGQASPQDLLDGARARTESGDHAGALAWTGRVLARGPDTTARRIAARALDRLGRYREADECRAQVTETLVERITALRLRGRMDEASELADEALATLDDEDDDRQAALIELARLRLVTGASKDARRVAGKVVEHYAERGLPLHTTALEAEELASFATVSLELFELRSSRGDWERSERRLAELHRIRADQLGPDNALTLGAAVNHGLTVVHLGRPDQARQLLVPIERACREHLGAGHPTTLTALYALGQASMQLSEDELAREQFEAAYTGRLGLLGATHADTLAVRLDLAIALMLCGDRRRSRQMIREIRRALPDAIGRKNDLFGRVQAADLLLPWMPVPALRMLIAAARWKLPWE